MKKLLCLGCLLAVVVAATAMDARAPQNQDSPIARKMREMDVRTDINLPVPVIRPRVEPAQLQAQATEIERLAQMVAPEIQQATHGVMPKDLSKNLKQIEKMCKHLRRDLNI